jgi:hypothetical protein
VFPLELLELRHSLEGDFAAANQLARDGALANNRFPQSACSVLLPSMLTETYRMRMASFTALIVMLALLPPRACAQAFDDTRFCQAMQETATERAAKHNNFTNHVAVVVLCNAKIVDFQMRPGVPVNALPPGWHERTHVLLNQMYCQGPMRAAIDNGWTVAFTIMSADGENHYMTAECR